MTAPLPPLPVRAVEALGRGDLVGAIKYLRAATPLDFASAKGVIEAYRRGEPWKIAVDASAAPPAPARASTVGTGSPGSPVSVPRPHAPASAAVGFSRDDEMHDATRFRDRAQGVGGRSPGEVRRGGPLLRGIVVIALIIFLVYRMAERVVHV